MKKSIILLYLLLTYSYAATQINHLLFTSEASQLYKTGNVYQGITKWNDSWIISQTDKNKKIIFSFLDSQGKIFYHQTVSYPSHGQDLSILLDKKNENIFYLVSSSKKSEGFAFFKVDMNKKIKIEFLFDKQLSKGFNTPTVSNDGHYLLVKNYNSIYVYRINNILKNKQVVLIYSFLLDIRQQQKDQWFQGISMCNGYIFCLSGNNKISSKKYLFVYDYYGKLINDYDLDTGKKFAKLKAKKWELEGLYCDNEKLYTSVMSGKDGHNIKQLYQILEIK